MHRQLRTLLLTLACALLTMFAARDVLATIGPVSYGQGPVMTAQKVYIVFWDFGHNGGDPLNVKRDVENEYNAIAGSPFIGVDTQYYCSAGGCSGYAGGVLNLESSSAPPYLDGHPLNYGLIGGIWSDDSDLLALDQTGGCPYDGNVMGLLCVTSSATSAEVLTAWNYFGQPDPANSLIVLVLPQQQNSSSACNNYGTVGLSAPCHMFFWDDCDGAHGTPPTGCGHNNPGEHWTTSDASGHVIAYATLNYTGGGAAFHEAMEAMTDPHPFTGWTVYNSGPPAVWDELDDPCSTPLDVQLAPSTFPNSGKVTVESQWSNHYAGGAGGCVFRYTQHVMRYYVDGAGAVHQDVLNIPGTSSDSIVSSSTLMPTPAIRSGAESAVVQWGYDRADFFGIDTASNLRHGYTNGGGYFTWAEAWPAQSGTSYASGPAVASWGNSHLDVFISESLPPTGNWPAQKTWDARTGWTSWNLLSPTWQPVSRIAATSWGPNRIDLFFLDSTGALRHGYTSNGGANWGWNTMWPAATFTGDPAVTSWGDQRLDVVAIKADGHLYHAAFDHGSYYGWDDWGNPGINHSFYLATASIVSLGEDRLHMEVPDQQGYVYQQDWDWGLHGWTALASPAFNVSPSLASW